MKTSEINIRDPFVLHKKRKFYLYGTRAKNFGKHTAGFENPIFTELEDTGDTVILKR